MPSLYLGRIGNEENIFEIHALTKSAGFREILPRSIADESLYWKLLEARYRLLSEGTTIYCTAVDPDTSKSVEYNPHDDRGGTIHFVAVDRNGEIEAALSVAVDIGDLHNGTCIGLPLENRYLQNGYPEGASLDEFRERYIRTNRNMDRDIEPYEMAEFYRHFKRFGKDNHLARLGLYCACYHLLFREAINKHQTPTTLLVYDAILQYYNQYRYAGGFLRDYALSIHPCIVSPSRRELVNNRISISFQGDVISRKVLVPFPVNDGEHLYFVKKEIPFLDGMVDFVLLQDAIDHDYKSLNRFRPDRLESDDRQLFIQSISIIMRRGIMDASAKAGELDTDMIWEFSEVGK